MFDSITTLIPYVTYIGQGLFLTLQLLLGGFVIGVVLGTLFAIARYKKNDYGIVRVIVSILRGTPVILQLSLVYFSLPAFGIKLDVMWAGILTFGINSSAYVAEILRAGIESLPKGQFEAAKTLQIPSYYTWKDIILPQVVKNILPAMVSEFIALLKETAVIQVIGGMDIMRKSAVLGAEKFTYFTPLLIAGCYYYFLVIFIEYIGKKIEQRGSYVKNK